MKRVLQRPKQMIVWQGQNYMMDASKLLSQTFSIFAESSKMWVIQCCHNGRQHPFFSSFLATFPESIASIAFVVDSRDQNPIRHTASFSLASIQTLIVCGASLRPRSFSHYCRMLFTFHRPLSIISKIVQFCFVSAAIHKWKFSPLNFSTPNHVYPNIELLCVSSLMSLKRFYDQCLVP